MAQVTCIDLVLLRQVLDNEKFPNLKLSRMVLDNTLSRKKALGHHNNSYDDQKNLWPTPTSNKRHEERTKSVTAFPTSDHVNEPRSLLAQRSLLVSTPVWHKNLRRSARKASTVKNTLFNDVDQHRPWNHHLASGITIIDDFEYSRRVPASNKRHRITRVPDA